MSSGNSSDQLIKNEIMSEIGFRNDIQLRIFPESSNQDQKLFSEGGLTFGYNEIPYGSCDAVWYIKDKEYVFPYDQSIISEYPVIALEGTDALDRGSSGNAQYQRFHHALGAVRGGSIGTYYLRPSDNGSIRPELYGMAYYATQVESGHYLITQDLQEVKNILDLISNHGIESEEVFDYVNSLIEEGFDIFKEWFKDNYDDWDAFAKKRSTIIFDNYVIKHAGRMKRNFTDGSQRAGHIAVGEMYLTKYFFPNKETLYLWPRMKREDIDDLNQTKINDKEWGLLTNEPNVTIITRDELIGLPPNVYNDLEEIQDLPLKGITLKKYNRIVKEDIVPGLKDGSITIHDDYLPLN